MRQERISKNAPCPCGSGKKYKKCCMFKENKMTDQEQPKLKNTFRDGDDIPSVSKEELLRRDQKVMMLQLRTRKALVLINDSATATSLGLLKGHLEELQRLPYSEGRDKVIDAVKRHMEAAEKDPNQLRFSRVDEVQLATLEMVLEAQEPASEQLRQLVPDEGKAVTNVPQIEQEQLVGAGAKVNKPAGPKMGPIKTDEDDIDDDDDEDD